MTGCIYRDPVRDTLCMAPIADFKLRVCLQHSKVVVHLTNKQSKKPLGLDPIKSSRKFPRDLEEWLDPPDTWRTVMCGNLSKGLPCKFGHTCSFAHSPKDMRHKDDPFPPLVFSPKLGEGMEPPVLEPEQPKADARPRMNAPHKPESEAPVVQRTPLPTTLEDCPICSDAVVDTLLLPCQHKVCQACVQRWRGNTVMQKTAGTPCPFCREVVTGTEVLTNAPPKLNAWAKPDAEWQQVKSKARENKQTAARPPLPVAAEPPAPAQPRNQPGAKASFAAPPRIPRQGAAAPPVVTAPRPTPAPPVVTAPAASVLDELNGGIFDAQPQTEFQMNQVAALQYKLQKRSAPPGFQSAVADAPRPPAPPAAAPAPVVDTWNVPTPPPAAPAVDTWNQGLTSSPFASQTAPVVASALRPTSSEFFPRPSNGDAADASGLPNGFEINKFQFSLPPPVSSGSSQLPSAGFGKSYDAMDEQEKKLRAREAKNAIIQKTESDRRSQLLAASGSNGLALNGMSLYDMEVAASRALKKEQEEADALLALKLAQEEEDTSRRARAEPVRVTSAGFWTCQVCTFDNQAAFDKCSMCMCPRP